jgi:NAD(P)-dependent dehydrogenase (short-subunit alcohol dehydrogenase family)
MTTEYLDQLFGLEGRVAVLTGGGGHIAGELARGLSRAGAVVWILDIRPEKAEAIAAAIRAEGRDAFALAMDVSNKEAWQEALETILGESEKVDILVNGAGRNAPTPPLEVAQEEWRQIFAVNLEGTFFGCQVVGEAMLERGRGSIINISSASADPPLSKAFAYSASKAAVRNLTQNLAREWAPRGVRVNALRPGFFPTAWSREHFITKDRERALLGHTPMGRFGEPSELVGCVIWLSSDASRFVTGAEIAVDGGFSAMTV